MIYLYTKQIHTVHILLCKTSSNILYTRFLSMFPAEMMENEIKKNYSKTMVRENATHIIVLLQCISQYI